MFGDVEFCVGVGVVVVEAGVVCIEAVLCYGLLSYGEAERERDV